MQVVRACTAKRQRVLGSSTGSCVHSTLGAACGSRQVAHDGPQRLREVQLGRERPRHPHLRAENGQTCVATVARQAHPASLPHVRKVNVSRAAANGNEAFHRKSVPPSSFGCSSSGSARRCACEPNSILEAKPADFWRLVCNLLSSSSSRCCSLRACVFVSCDRGHQTSVRGRRHLHLLRPSRQVHVQVPHHHSLHHHRTRPPHPSLSSETCGAVPGDQHLLYTTHSRLCRTS
jgi:hypothetical protein